MKIIKIGHGCFQLRFFDNKKVSFWISYSPILWNFEYGVRRPVGWKVFYFQILWFNFQINRRNRLT